MRGFTNLYHFELRQNIRSLTIWWVMLSLVLIFFMSIFPSMSSSDFSELVNAKLAAMPKSLSEVVGLDMQANFQDVVYFFTYCFQFVSIALTVYAINLGSHIVSKEHVEKHVDYLATKPVAKGTIVAAKYAAVLTLIILLTVLVALVGAGCLRGFGREGWHWLEIWRIFGVSVVQYLFWGSIAASVSLSLPKTSPSAMTVLGGFFVTYIMGAVSKVIDKVENLKYLSPYYMFETVTLPAGLERGELLYMAGLIILALALTVLGWWRYQLKDLSL